MSFFLLLLLRPLSLHWMIYGLVGSFSLILNTLNQILLLMLLHNAQTHKTGRNNGEKDFGVSKTSTIPSALFVFVLLQFNWMTWSTRSCEWHIIVARDHYRSCNFSNLSKISLIEKEENRLKRKRNSQEKNLCCHCDFRFHEAFKLCLATGPIIVRAEWHQTSPDGRRP